MGDSISEGTIAAVLKQTGDRVEEDEPILQIETDKVTVDVRAPHEGVISRLLVKENDNVTVGQTVAVLSAGDAPPKSKEAKPAQPKPSKQPAAEAKPAAAPPAQPKQEAEPAAVAAPHRTPSLKFPPRRTEDGRRISDLPAAEAKKYLEEHASREAAQPAAQPSSRPAGAAAKPSRPTAQQVFRIVEPGTKLSSSRVLSQKEIDEIELGGAGP
ncbi:hypothetical protein WJX72_011518 [[Myrmecia] bisecta]|uniref:Lipoyl-binding domain-containing protein n=1 Tax=[Myrmecia] bisecta TaxID=41462 RepID=A0AAW1P776_9CHLO